VGAMPLGAASSGEPGRGVWTPQVQFLGDGDLIWPRARYPWLLTASVAETCVSATGLGWWSGGMELIPFRQASGVVNRETCLRAPLGK
jgi:hypothetical protein